MLRILVAMLALSLLTVGYARADGEFSGTDIIDPADAPDYAEDSDYVYEEVPAGEPVPVNPDNMGMYFGTGDEFRGGVPQGEGEYYLMHDHDAVFDATGADYHDEQIYYPGYYGEGTYGADNVYGPLWGVPEDAAGLEGYQSEYYLYNPDGEQVWTPYEGEHQHDTADTTEDSADSADGLDITSSEDW
jgi:hypothetical protein